MYDPRLNSIHLCPSRRKEYGEARAEMLESMGSTTQAVERLIREHPVVNPFAGPVHYFLKNVRTDQRYPLRVGINTIGRAPTNDIVLECHAISRRHCVVLVHDTGGCEVHDTASLNGTFVNRRKVSRSALYPGDRLQLCDDVFEVLGVAAEDETFVLAAKKVKAGNWNDTGDHRKAE